jgi:hypothetical protein
VKKFLLIISLFSLVAFSPARSLGAEGTFLKYSVNAHTEDVAAQKGLSLGYQDELAFLEKKWEIGFWSDHSGRDGAKSSAFGSYSIGVEPTAGALYVNFFQGVGLISSPDTVLGGPAQFFEDFGFGIRDQKTKVSIGFQYKHISSAGIFKPNQGRDTLGLQIMIPW